MSLPPGPRGPLPTLGWLLGPLPPGTYPWIPFGGGVRRCIGASFALFEMTTVLGVVGRGLERLVPDRAASEPVARRAITLVPGRGAALRATPVRRTPPVPTGR